jgi:manganese/iron transport system ATP-binding protein
MTGVLAGLLVRRLYVRLGEESVLEDVSLVVGQGEIVGLVGPNGAGKTTLLRAILGLVPAEAGQVLIEGLPIDSARDRVAYVPQRHEFAWEFPITVWETVMTGRTKAIGWLRRPGSEDKTAVAEALERTGISNLANRPIGELSGGQRQRVLIARALALRPSLLLMDEPFSAVDVPTQRALTSLLAQLQHEGQTLLITTHDLPAAIRTCTRLALLNRRVIAEGAPEKLRDPEVWLRAFGVETSEGLIASVGEPR